jgi:hypothetical protein
LQEDRVIDRSFRAAPAQNAVSEDEFHPFCFAIDAAVERVECFEDFHCRTSGLFGLHPVLALRFPTLQARGPDRVVGKLHNPRLCTFVGLLQSFFDRDEVRRVVPPVFEPCANFLGRFWRKGQTRTPHLQNVIRAAVFCALAVPVLSPRRTSLPGAAPYGRMLWQVAQSEMPGLLANLPLGGVAVLIQGFQIAEHACELVPRDAKFFGIHN